MPASLFLDDRAGQRIERSLTANESALPDLHPTLSPEHKTVVRKYVGRRPPSSV
ncbi:hypothetical protein NFI95_16660 [Acetobacteraceae bacterium KSS8]|uniref:Uncharacterized protein n=1 Tax=Endosaccharibacter trunci TaxID=2812733 RepID=A0ABT1WB00_9PROT|nr:hypothetical protein [Acetobacteraceae bacterium KSS8]